MKILFWLRPDIFDRPGGDTTVVNHLRSELDDLGHTVVVDTRADQDPREFDVLHLVNFATPRLTDVFARIAVTYGKPYVVTSFYEDFPRFFSQMQAYSEALTAYMNNGYRPEVWSEVARNASRVAPAAFLDNRFAAQNADIVIVTGAVEGELIRRDYPGVRAVESVKLAADVKAQAAPELFESEFKVRDFVLSIGRIEHRKNQLMLLKALEHSSVPVVLVGGKKIVDENYLNLCRHFRRAGPTLILDYLSEEQLASAFRAARVHALPSWYELPGLVSLEAALHGTPVVVADAGTTRDYLGDFAFYCSPEDPESIRSAVERAMMSQRSPAQVAHLSTLTWKSTARDYLSIFEKVKDSRTRGVSIPGIGDIDYLLGLRGLQDRSVFSESLFNFADSLARAGHLQMASRYYEEMRHHEGCISRSPRSQGVMCLASGNHRASQHLFALALERDSSDMRARHGARFVSNNPSADECAQFEVFELLGPN